MNTIAKEQSTETLEIESRKMLENESRTSIVRLFDGISNWIGTVCSLIVLVIGLMICYEVFSRFLFNEPTSWVTEFSVYLFLAATFLAAAYAHLSDAHIRVEVLLDSLSDRMKHPILQLSAWMGFLFVLLAAWQLVIFVISEYQVGTMGWGLVSTPLWIPESAIALGFILFCPAVLAEIRKLDLHLDRKRELLGLLLLVILVAVLLFMGMRPPKIGDTDFDWAIVSVCTTVFLVSWLWSGLRTAVSFAGLVVTGGLFFFGTADSTNLVQGGLMAVYLMILMALGVRIAFALGLVGSYAVFFYMPSPQLQIVAERAWNSANSFTYTALPMFILMGAFLLRSGVSTDMFNVMLKWLGRLPGGIAHATVLACGIFAAVSGSSLATAATMGMTAAPEMIKNRYSPRLAYGVVAAGGTLGILIPPSIAMILYGSLVGVPVSTLFIAGIIPGLVLMSGFIGVIVIWSVAKPDAAPKGKYYTWREKISSSLDVLPFMLLILGVLGSLYLGVATPTEAGALGALAAGVLCFLKKKMSMGILRSALLETAQVTSFVMVIVFASSVMGYTFDYIQLPKTLVNLVNNSGLAPGLVITVLMGVYIILGMFIDPISIMLMTWSVSVPVVVSLGLDPIWFGVFLVMMIEIGLITPPVGMILFVLKGMSGHILMKEIIIGVLPFIVVFLCVIFLFYLFPEIVMWFPNMMNN